MPCSTEGESDLSNEMLNRIMGIVVDVRYVGLS